MPNINLKSLTQRDAETIRHWPPYPATVQELDYALRVGGWLDQFPEDKTSRRFAAWQPDVLVGFTLLTHIADGAAEFYIALHPNHIGQGIGREITERTLAIGFNDLKLTMIYLKVREWHERAIALYAKIGFKPTGKFIEVVQNKPVHFVRMELIKPK